jgi:hypothetical protein
VCRKKHLASRWCATAIAPGTIRSMEQQLPHPLREGQIAFNRLYVLNPELAEQVRGTEADPFYDDSRLPAFHERVEELRRDV